LNRLRRFVRGPLLLARLWIGRGIEGRQASVKGETFSHGGPIAVFERLDRCGRKRRRALLFGLSNGLVGIEERCAHGLGPGLVIERANRLKFAQEMGVAEGVIDVFPTLIGAPMVVNHNAARELRHGRTRLVGAIERRGRGRGGVPPTGLSGDAQAGLAEAAHRRRRDAFADGAIEGASASAFRRNWPRSRRRPPPRRTDLGELARRAVRERVAGR
jgi:hypothetical protein